MASYTKFDAFIEALAEKKHNLGSDVLEIALSNAANPPSTSLDAVLADITTVSTANITDKTLNVTDSSQTGGTYKLIADDQILLSGGGSTGPFRYVILFNQTASNDELIGWYDYGSEITLNVGEQITLDFSPTNGVLQLA